MPIPAPTPAAPDAEFGRWTSDALVAESKRLAGTRQHDRFVRVGRPPTVPQPAPSATVDDSLGGLHRKILDALEPVAGAYGKIVSGSTPNAEAAMSRLPYETVVLCRALLRISGFRERLDRMLDEHDNPKMPVKHA
jgi:hypothetical protein